MTRVRVESFSISLDGYGAGEGQSLDNPMGAGGRGLHGWAFPTDTFQKMFGGEGGTKGIDDQFASRGFLNLGAWIMGRNMFSPFRGPWSDDSWKGWWGDNPPYHVPVFVLTNHPRESLKLSDTTFHFITGGIYEALERARQAADGKDIRIGGGVSTVRQYLTAGLIDEVHLAISPVLIGKGEHLLGGIDLPALGYRCVESRPSGLATHIVLKKE